MLGQVRRIADAGTPDGKLSWAPQADLRNFGPRMLDIALSGLAEKSWEPWFAEYAEGCGLAGADLVASGEVFRAALVRFMEYPAGNVGEALAAAGFFAEPLPCQLAIFGRIGQVALGHLAYALGHATAGVGADAAGVALDPQLPYREALDRLGAEGAKIAAALAQPPTRRIDRLGLGLQLLSPYAVDGEVSEDIGVDCRGVPEAVAARLKAIGWRWYDDAVAGVISGTFYF